MEMIIEIATSEKPCKIEDLETGRFFIINGRTYIKTDHNCSGVNLLSGCEIAFSLGSIVRLAECKCTMWK